MVVVGVVTNFLQWLVVVFQFDLPSFLSWFRVGGGGGGGWLVTTSFSGW